MSGSNTPDSIVMVHGLWVTPCSWEGWIGGSEDHIMPPSVNRPNARHWAKSPALTEYHEFDGRAHWTCADPGWEEVAGYALDWTLGHVQPQPSALNQISPR